VTTTRPSAFELLAQRYERRGAAAYLHDPLGFVDNCVRFPAGHDGEPGGLTPYQRENFQQLEQQRRLAVRGPHGLGKTTTNALAVHWFALTRDAARIDWKVITTAGAWRQLTKYLWPEIHKWAHYIDWEAVGRRPYTLHELLDLNLKLAYGQASAVAASDKELIEGAHADSLLYIYDESKAIKADIFDASEGAYSGARKSGLPEAYGLAQSTPGEMQGRFYDIHVRKPGLEDWAIRHVTKLEVIDAGRMSPDWAGQRARQWGEDSAVYANRVLGEFHSSDEDSVIPLAWVEAANERWQAWRDQGSPIQLGRRIKGVDVARGGADLTVIANRIGPIVFPLETASLKDTTKVADLVQSGMHQTDLSIVDVIGVGAGVVDLLRRRLVPTYAFNASRKSGMRDRSGEFGFVNQRAAMWWTLREMLDPAFEPTLALPTDDVLLGELTSPKWWLTPSGRIQVEGKDEVRKRLGRSTDHADAVGQSLLTDAEFNDPPADGKPDTVQYERNERKAIAGGDAFGWE
jgi:hypothetical protein